MLASFPSRALAGASLLCFLSSAARPSRRRIQRRRRRRHRHAADRRAREPSTRPPTCLCRSTACRSTFRRRASAARAGQGLRAQRRHAVAARADLEAGHDGRDVRLHRGSMVDIAIDSAGKMTGSAAISFNNALGGALVTDRSDERALHGAQPRPEPGDVADLRARRDAGRERRGAGRLRRRSLRARRSRDGRAHRHRPAQQRGQRRHRGSPAATSSRSRTAART